MLKYYNHNILIINSDMGNSLYKNIPNGKHGMPYSILVSHLNKKDHIKFYFTNPSNKKEKRFILSLGKTYNKKNNCSNIFARFYDNDKLNQIDIYVDKSKSDKTITEYRGEISSYKYKLILSSDWIIDYERKPYILTCILKIKKDNKKQELVHLYIPICKSRI